MKCYVSIILSCSLLTAMPISKLLRSGLLKSKNCNFLSHVLLKSILFKFSYFHNMLISVTHILFGGKLLSIDM